MYFAIKIKKNYSNSEKKNPKQRSGQTTFGVNICGKVLASTGPPGAILSEVSAIAEGRDLLLLILPMKQMWGDRALLGIHWGVS